MAKFTLPWPLKVFVCLATAALAAAAIVMFVTWAM
jgi:hypothetical protein